MILEPDGAVVVAAGIGVLGPGAGHDGTLKGESHPQIRVRRTGDTVDREQVSVLLVQRPVLAGERRILLRPATTLTSEQASKL